MADVRLRRAAIKIASERYDPQNEREFRAQVGLLQHQIDNLAGRLKTDTLDSVGAALALEDISDVTITSIASGEVLKWNGSAWINNTLAEAGISATGHVHSGADITSGTVADARLSSNVPLLDVANTFTGAGAAMTLKQTGTPRLDFIEEDVSSTDKWRVALAGGSMRFQSVDTATGNFEFRRSGGTIVAQIANASPGSGLTNLWIRDVGNLERVTVGATDSGGTGFRVLRLPN